MTLGPEGTRGEGDILVLAGEGPHAPVAARRAGEFVAAAGEETTLTLFNVQQPADDDEEDLSPEERGQTLVEEMAERAGIEYMNFETRVEVTDGGNLEDVVLSLADEYDTVCVGATRSGAVTQALFGSLPETIGERAEGTVVMARGPEQSPLSIREAIIRRLEVSSC